MILHDFINFIKSDPETLYVMYRDSWEGKHFGLIFDSEKEIYLKYSTFTTHENSHKFKEYYSYIGLTSKDDDGIMEYNFTEVDLFFSDWWYKKAIQLSECPSCGDHHDVKIHEGYARFREEYRVICSCGMATIFEQDPLDVVKIWNKRI